MEQQQQSWFQLTAIQVGGALCLPVIMVGQILVKTYGILPALVALAVGNSLLFVLGVLTIAMTLRARTNTLENAKSYFGVYGSRIFALTMTTCLMGWFAIQLNLMSLSIHEMILKVGGLASFNTVPLTLGLGVLITLGAQKGIIALDKISAFSMPILIGTLTYALYITATAQKSVQIPLGVLSFEGVSLIVATAIAAMVDLPTYYRFARSKRDAFISIALVCLVALPAIEFVGVYLGAYTEGSILDTLSATGGVLWKLWVCIFIVLAGWATNNTNIYSSSIGLEQLIPSVAYSKRVFLVGTLGTVLACLGVLDKFELMLEGMGIFVASMAAVIITRFLLNHLVPTPNSWTNILAWACATSFGILSLLKVIKLSDFALVDTWIVAMVVVSITAGIKYFFNNERNNEKTDNTSRLG
jgi:cytosine permease